LWSAGAPPLAVGAWVTPSTCYRAEFGRSRSNGTSVIKEIGLKFDPRVPPFNSRSFKVIGTDTDRYAAYEFLLMFHSNHEHFPPPRVYLTFLLKGFPWNWLSALELKQEAQLMLTNPRDAFRGQSRSPNIVYHSIC